ncbi:MAG: polyphosphate polymerase domain-containing protein [bacterium]|nr:polyphosphate polymerase domain-containing protein [bacterium]
MAGIQYIFKRYEKKFLLTREQYKAFVSGIGKWMTEDEYGIHTVCNIYYDTDNYDLIRTSIDSPLYKEKFRIRSYGVPGSSDTVYAEIKKKFNGIVYKRRVAATPFEVQRFLGGSRIAHEDAQIQREIQWFLHKYNPTPKVFIGYERVAFVGRENPELRITFDWNIRWRQNELNLRAGMAGMPVLAEDRIVMEIKLVQAMPLWLAALLSELRIYASGFSKYGVCYRKHLAVNLRPQAIGPESAGLPAETAGERGEAQNRFTEREDLVC